MDIEKKLDILQTFVDSTFDSDNFEDLQEQANLLLLACWALGYTPSECKLREIPLGDASKLPQFELFLTDLGAFVNIIDSALTSKDPVDSQVIECFRLQRQIKRSVFSMIKDLKTK